MAIEVVAQSRKLQGTGASRRLRNAGRIPGILYGGKKEAQLIEFEHNALFHQLRNEKFHASILTLKLDGAEEQVLLRTDPYYEVNHTDQARRKAYTALTGQPSAQMLALMERDPNAYARAAYIDPRIDYS